MTKLAYKRISQIGINSKETLQRSCENEVFPLYKRSIDPAKQRVMAKYIDDKNAGKFLNSTKTDKDRYYEKFVE